MRKANRFLSLLLVFTMIAGMLMAASVTTVSAASKIKIIVDGKTVSTDADPIIVNDRTLVPISTIVDHLGGNASWNGSTSTATITYKDTTIVLRIGSYIATVNGSARSMDVAPSIVTVNRNGGGRTMVPIRFVAETLQFDVDWDAGQRAVIINTVSETVESSSIGIYVNGAKLRLDANPIIVNERTLVPVSTIVDFLGGSADWESSDSTVTLKYNGTTIVLKVGSVAATVNGVRKYMDVTPRIVEVAGGGRTMVPIRFIAESFDFNVDWDSRNDAVLITTKEPTRSYVISEMTLTPGQLSGDVYYTTLMLRADESLKDLDLNGIFLSSPYRWYIDIPSSTFASGVRTTLTQDVAASYVSGVRTGAQDNGAMRIVADLKGNLRPYLSYSSDGRSMIIAFRDATTPSGKANDGKSVETETPSNTGSENNTGAGESSTGAGSDTPPVHPVDSKQDDTGTGAGQAELPVFDLDPIVLGHTNGGEEVALDTSRYEEENYNPWADGKLVAVIDAGHGKTTGGKRSPDSTLMEWEFNRVVAYKLKALLEAQGVTCVMTVAYDEQGDPALAERVAIANAVEDADLFVSVHANAYTDGWTSANGWEIYSAKTGDISEKLAKYIEASTKELVPELRDRGTKTANFRVIADTVMPAVLIEHGFYTNQTEVKLLKSDSFRDRLAKADCKGIMNFFNSYR